MVRHLDKGLNLGSDESADLGVPGEDIGGPVLATELKTQVEPY